MKITSFLLDGKSMYGVVDGDSLVAPPAEFLRSHPTLTSVLAADAIPLLERIATEHGVCVNRGMTTSLPAISDPGKCICVGLNYKDHVAETNRSDSPFPALFVRFADSLTGDGAKVMVPACSHMFDWEGELAVVIGRRGRSISKADAWDHIAGYTCFNDITVRDWQRHTIQWTPGKNFPGTGALGPWFVTRDEVPDIRQSTLETRVNGNVMQHAPISSMIFDIPFLIEYISSFTPLSPGDVIATGTPGGVGDRRVPQIYMKPGDAVEVEISGLGILRNQIVGA